MSAETDCYNLYNVYRGEEHGFVIVKALRPEFSNADQTQEDMAWVCLEENRKSIIELFCKENKYSRYEFVAECMDYPVGEIFYGNSTGVDIEVWISMHSQGEPYFAFGKCDTEDYFWSELKDDYKDGDCYIFPDLVRPAKKHKVLYLQQKT